MKRIDIDNTNLAGHDWASSDRLRFLRSVTAGKTSKQTSIAGVDARAVWGTDVSGNDRRSVKAALVGRGNLRALWWELNQRVHNAMFAESTLQDAMYHFHRRHGLVTLWRLELANDFWEIVAAVRNGGVEEGIATGLRQLRLAIKRAVR
jgi:hypothetical protein